MIRRVLVYSTGVVALVALFWMIGGDPIQLLSNLSPAWLLLTATSWISVFIIRGVRWKILLSPISRNISFSNSFWSISMSYLVNLILPTKWCSEVARAISLSRRENTKLFPTLSSIVVEKMLDLLGMVMLASAALVFIPSVNVPNWVFYALKILALLVVIMIAGLFVVSWKSVCFIDRLKSCVNGSGRISRALVGMLCSLADSVEWMLRNPRPFLRSFALTFVLWVAFSMGVYSIFFSLGMKPQPLVVLLGSLLFSFAYVLPNVPGYVGTYEGMWVLIFFGLGVGTSRTVLAGALVGHLISMSITVTLGSIGLAKVGLTLAESIRMRNSKTRDVPTVFGQNNTGE